MKRILTSIGAAILTAVLTVGSLPAYAAEQTGSITILPFDTANKQYLTAANYDGTFRVYRVADYDGYGNFTKADGFGGYDGTDITGDNLSADKTFKEITEAVTAYVSANRGSLTKVAEGVPAGKKIENLSWGLYFVEADKASTTWNAFTSFLVMIPDYHDNQTKVDVEGYPKVTKPTTPPDDNPPGDNPPSPPSNPPKDNPPENTIDEIGDEEDNGYIDEGGMITEGGAMTGDSSQIAVYGAIAAAAVVVLLVWFVWKKRNDKKNS